VISCRPPQLTAPHPPLTPPPHFPTPPPPRDVIHAASNSLAADTENLLQSLLQACRQAQAQAHQQAAAAELAGAVARYQCLLQLLRGRWPEALLPPCSAGYVAARLTTLAQGNCLEAYQWNAGGGGGEGGGLGWGLLGLLGLGRGAAVAAVISGHAAAITQGGCYQG
jgi:hypothetical protein